MDGVVADWRSNARKLVGYDNFNPDQHYSESDWELIKGDGRIFTRLPLMPRANELVNIARKYRDKLGWELYFLTAVPHNNDVPWAFHDKAEWARLHFTDIPVHFGPYSEDKYLQCRPGYILVDDRVTNCDAWRAHGGIAIKVGLTLASAIEELSDDYASRETNALYVRRLLVETL